MTRLNSVKIIRNYKSDNEYIQKNISATILPEISFFDIDADIKKGDYVIVPMRSEPLLVENVWIYGIRPVGNKEVILKPESEYLAKQMK